MTTIENPMSVPEIDRLFKLMNESTCNFLAVDAMRRLLEEKGFRPLDEGEEWKIEKGGKYYVVKNGSAIFAFVAGTAPLEEAGLRIVAAHSDSPCFKLKPNCEIKGDGGVISLNVEKYGGGIMYTWFDRPLSISGRVMVPGKDALHPRQILVDVRKPVATIPHLAIHFNREVNDGNPLSVQKDMKPVIGYYSSEELLRLADENKRFKERPGAIRHIIAETLRNQGEDIKPEDIIDYELCLYPAEPVRLIGAHEEYFQSARIDDLSMAFAGLEAILSECDRECSATRVLAVFDNEETGSGTKQGAHSPVLRHIVERICISMSADPQAQYRALAKSFMISADDAHAWHPNYNDKYDPTNHPVLGNGPVVKINANCKYMTDAEGAAVFRLLCEKAGVNAQYFVNHADVAGGSTLGNISSAQLDVPGVDVGNAIWAMHSAAETAAVSDHLDMIRVMREFFN